MEKIKFKGYCLLKAAKFASRGFVGWFFHTSNVTFVEICIPFLSLE
jgi:hypothetical protein